MSAAPSPANKNSDDEILKFAFAKRNAVKRPVREAQDLSLMSNGAKKMNSENFQEDVRSQLKGAYFLPDGTEVKGQAVSYLLTQLRGQYGWSNLPSKRLWRNLGQLVAFERLLREQGFKVTYKGRNNRGQKTIVVHEETLK